jgi:hypothetical protein
MLKVTPLLLFFVKARKIDQQYADVGGIYTAYSRRLTYIHRPYLLELFSRLKS